MIQQDNWDCVCVGWRDKVIDIQGVTHDYQFDGGVVPILHFEMLHKFRSELGERVTHVWFIKLKQKV